MWLQAPVLVDWASAPFEDTAFWMSCFWVAVWRWQLLDVNLCKLAPHFALIPFLEMPVERAFAAIDWRDWRVQAEGLILRLRKVTLEKQVLS